MSWRAGVALVPVVALLAVLLYGVTANGTGQSLDTAVAAGRRPAAPTLTLPRLGSTDMDSLAAHHGQVVVLNYWASWCVPCRDETPLLQRWHERILPRQGTVLGVDALDAIADARTFVGRFHLTYPILRDRDGHTGKAFGVRGYPETLVLDRRGRIAAIRRGPIDEAFLRDEVLPLL
jgi:cytochrome c biogenesis protein CcmG/thiol:disulfide interchange protein DsbE